MTGKPNAASVALIDRDKVLLIQRARPPYLGLWTLPGGRLEPGEDAETAATREVTEELGVRCHSLRPVLVMQLGGEARFVLQVFATDVFEGEIVPSGEVAAWRWAGLGGIGHLATTDGLGGVLEQAFAVLGRT
jgi:8-oxo-dGTP diphosphatase